MAQQLELLKNSGTVSNLLTGNLQVKVDGWSVQAVTGEGDPVWDTFNLIGRGTSDAVLGSAVYDIQNFLSEARRRANNTSRDDAHWLSFKPESSEEVQTLITNGAFAVQSDPGAGGLGPLMNSDGYLSATLAIEHMPWWEKAVGDSQSVAGISLLGGMSYGGTVLNCGDLPGRINYLRLGTVSNTTYLDDIWVGIRPTYGGTADFIALWECEDGVLMAGGGATNVASADASGGTAVRIDFSGTASMIRRMRIGIADLSGGGTATNFTGQYLVLGRLKCGSATECLVDLYHGLSEVGYGGVPTGLELIGETKVTNTDYQLIELGQAQFPPYGIRVLEKKYTGLSDILDSALHIYAQRLSGSSYLYIDCLVLIPSEHLFTTKNAGIDNPLDYIYLMQGSDGKSICICHHASGRAEIIEHSVVDFTYPPDGGIFVFAGQAAASHDLTANIDLRIDQYPRYSLLRLT